MAPAYAESRVTLYCGDCLTVMRDLPEASVDAIVTDPPYGLEFMGKEWDGADGFRRTLNAADVSRDNPFGRTSRTSPQYRAGHLFGKWSRVWAVEVLRVLKPGGHLLAFGASRTWHRLACAIEDAGFEIRDCLMWLYGSGFPKSLDVSKAIDKAAGAPREVVAEGEPVKRMIPGADQNKVGWIKDNGREFVPTITAPATDDARRWQGWGTALKPSWEPIILARKSLSEPTVAANVLKHGTGAINIDGCRVGTSDDTARQSGVNGVVYGADDRANVRGGSPLGRWPANVLLAHTVECEALGCSPDCPVRLLDEQSGELTSGANPTRRGSDKFRGIYSDFKGQEMCDAARGVDIGGASRFFYTAKADRQDRDGSKHPTVKPTDLMAYLIRLITPPGGLVLDPFCGSGPTVWAAREYGFSVIGIDREQEYIADTIRRLRQGVLL